MKGKCIPAAAAMLLFGCGSGQNNHNVDMFDVSMETADVNPNFADSLHGSKEEENNMIVAVNGKEYSASLADTEAAQQFKEMLPIVMDMQELNGNEKYGDLPSSLTQCIYQPGTIQTGDILLWGDDTLVLFYKDLQSPYSYTEIGHINDPATLIDQVQTGIIRVTFQ